MKVINEINHKILGKIVCIEDQNENPLMWMKNMNLKLFSKNEVNVNICFNFYCFNKNFKYDSFWNNKAENIEKEICLTYKKFLSEIKKVECEFYEYFKDYYFDEFDPDITKQDINVASEVDLYKYVDVVEVRIMTNSYSIIIRTPWEEDKIGIIVYNDEDGITVNYESEVEPVEMDYE